jgi:mannitol/fructose-specific phosphotransferase system IIA component (Ntr-type)
MVNLASLLSLDQIVTDMGATERWPAIVELVERLCGCGKLSEAEREGVLEALRQREERCSTGVGGGVAIPHAFLEGLEEVVAVFGRSGEGIEFEAYDNAPVHFVVLFLVPKNQYGVHLATLAAIARQLNNLEVRERLGAAETADEIRAAFASRVKSREAEEV